MADLFSTYGFRKLITIHHSVDGALSGYPVLFHVMRSTGSDTTETYGRETANKVYVGTNCLTTYYDVVLTPSDGVTIVKQWTEVINGTTDAYIWFKVDVPASGDWTGYLYYGKPSETVNPDDGPNTFTFFDDFSGTLTNKWQDDTAQGSNSGGILTYTYALAAWKAIHSKSAYSGDLVFKSLAQMVHRNFNDIGLRTGTDQANGVLFTYNAADYWQTIATANTVFGTADVSGSAYHTLEVSRVLTGTDTSSGWLDNSGTAVGSTTLHVPTVDMRAHISVYGMSSQTSDWLVDWCFIAKTTATMPTWGANGAAEKSAYVDVATRFKSIVQVYTDIATRFKVWVQAYKDVSTRYKLWVTSYKDITSRFNLNARSYIDVATRYSLTATTYRDAATRYLLQVRGYLDTATRFKVIARTYKDITSRMKLVVLVYPNVATRYRVAIQQFIDTATRFIVESGYTYKNALTRFVLNSVVIQTYTDAATRFKVAIRALKDAATRFKVVSQAYTNAATRYRVAVRAYTDIATRFKAIARTFKDAASRYRIIGISYRTIVSRFKLELAIIYIDVKTRLRLALRSGVDIKTRFRLVLLHQTISIEFPSNTESIEFPNATEEVEFCNRTVDTRME